MIRLLREPLLHFLLLGAVLLCAREFLAPWIWPEKLIVTPEEQAMLAERWRSQSGRDPGPDERAALIEQHVNEELLYREARRLGLHKTDVVIRQRLLNNMKFIEQENQASDDELIHLATRLGMLDSDLVVRRRLIQRMRHRLESEVQVSEADALVYYQENRNEFLRPDRYQFRHVFFSASRPGTSAHQAVTELLARLEAGHEPASGDLFLPGNRFAQASPAEIEKQFGKAVATRVTSGPVAQWFGPVESAFGQHLFFIEKVHPGKPLAFAQVRARIAARLYAEREARHLRESLAQIRSRYCVDIRKQGEKA